MEKAWWMRNRSRLPLFAAVFALLLAVAASCGGGEGGGGGGQGGGGGGDTGNLVVGYDQEPPSLNPFTSDAAATADMIEPMLEKPYQPQPDLSIAPELADGDPRVVSEDPFTIEYKLKEGLQWSDGEPLTSADARFTFDQIMNPDNQIITREGYDQVTEFQTPDDLTVRMVFEQPYAAWRDMISGSNGYIVPQHALEGEDFNTALNDEIPASSGPYQFGEFRKGESISVERNPNWYGGEAPIEQISFRFIPDTNSLVAAQQAGEVNFINPPPDIGLAEKLEGIDGSQTARDAGTIWEALHFNLEKIPNLQLRQAVAYGVNREQVINEILAGQDVPTLQSVIVPDLEEYYVPAWEDYTYDPDRARELVQEAEDAGADPTIEFSTTSGNALRETLQQVIQQQLQDVGITVTIKNYSAEQFFGEITVGGDFTMGEWAWVQTPDPQITTLFAGNSLPPDGQNYYRYQNEEVTRLLEESDRTIDEGQRAELIKQAQELMAEDVPIIPLFQRPQIYAFSDNLSGPVVNSTLAGPFWNIGEWELQ